MTTLIPKFDLKDGGATPTNAINRPINQKLAESISILDFGADSTGATDSTTAIQNAINYAASVKGCNIFVPFGTYNCSGTLSIPAITIGLGLIGEGRDNTNLGGSRIVYTGTSSVFILAADVTSRFITLENLDISASNASFTGTLFKAQVYDFNVNRVHFTAPTGATALLDMLDSDDVLITQCFFRGANYNLIGGIVNASVIQECDFGKYGSYAVNFTNASGMTFQGCAFEPNANTYQAGGITGTYTGLNIIGCWMGDVVTASNSPTSNWIYVQGYAINITGNYINGDGYHLVTAIVIKGATYGINVTGNYISGMPTCINLGSGYSHDVIFLANYGHEAVDAFVTGTVAGGTALIQNWVYATSSPQLDLIGSLSATLLQNPPIAVSSLQAPNATGAGYRAFVCDATATTFASTVASTTTTLSGVAITGTSGQFSCNAATIAIGMPIVISGTFGGTGSIVGYTNPTTYYVVATNGTTTFTLSPVFNDIPGVIGTQTIKTTAGTPTGLTYTISTSTNRVPVYCNGTNWVIG